MAKKNERKEEKELKKNVGDNNEVDSASEEKQTATQEEKKEQDHDNELEELKKKLEEKEQEIKELKHKYLMALAEIENMRKKMLRDKQAFYRSGVKDMALGIIHILDDVERAIEQITEANDMDAVREGILLIHRKFKQLLESRDIKPIESKGKQFDPDLHEALMKIETEKDEDHMKVIDEIQKGYMLGDEVLRHSKVVVAVKNESKSEKQKQKEDASQKDDKNEEEQSRSQKQ